MDTSNPNVVTPPATSTGWKTYLAAAVAILGGALAIANGEYAEGGAGIVAGLALVGIRGAIAKVIEAVLSKKS